MKLKSLTRAAAAAGIALVVTAGAAAAQSITYSTMGALTGVGCSGNSCTSGGFTITFNGLGSTTVIAPTNISYGEFQTTGDTPPGSFAAGFTLTVTQSNPAAGSSSFTGNVSGTISATNSGIVSVAFDQQQILLGTSVYRLDNLSYNINPPATNNGMTTIQGSLVTPEPATFVLLGTGIAGLGLFGLRRRQSVTQA